MCEKITLYHGSSKIVEKPKFGFGKADNDYGSGFYTTEVEERACDWALKMGDEDNSYVNIYTLDTIGLNIINLDDYDVLAWIAEIVFNRHFSQIVDDNYLREFINNYKIDTDNVDVIIGYRADDSYADVINNFILDRLTIDEVKKLFYKGELGVQYFIKSQKAFNSLKFVNAYKLDIEQYSDNEDIARREVLKFLNNRLRNLTREKFVGLRFIDVVVDKYVYDSEYDIYIKG